MKFFIFVFTLLLACSCTNSEKGKEASSVDESSSVSAETVIGMGFDEKLFKPLSLPLQIDTNFVMNADTNDRLNYLQVRALTGKGLESGLEYEIRDLCMIDSMKQNKTYEAYVKKLDIGMIKNSIAFRIGYSSLASGKLFLWGIEYGSYEACPYFSGKMIILSIFSSKGETKHFVIGKRSGAGDPPSTMHEDIVSDIEKDGTISTKIITVSDDLDVAGEEKTVRTFKVVLNETGIETKENKCDTLSKEQSAETPR